MSIMMDFMLMPSLLLPIACGGIGASIPTAGGGIPTTAGAGDGVAGMTLGIGEAVGHGIIPIGTIRIGIMGGETIRIVGEMPIRPAAHTGCVEGHQAGIGLQSLMAEACVVPLQFGKLLREQPAGVW